MTRKRHIILLGLCLFTLFIGRGTSAQLDSGGEHFSYFQDSIIFNKYKEIPRFIRQYLNSTVKGKFKVAEVGEPWNAGCDISNNKPRMQFVNAYLYDTCFRITFLQGGIGVVQRSLVATVKDDKVINYRLVEWP